MIDRRGVIRKFKHTDEEGNDITDYESLARLFVGEVISDMFCNGFFGSSEYDLSDATITRVFENENENPEIEVRKIDSRYAYAEFDDQWSNWKEVYEHLDEWVFGEEL